MKAGINHNYFPYNQKIIEYYILIGLFYFHFITTSSITVRFAFMFTFLLSCLFHKSFHRVYNIRSLIIIILLSLFLTFYHGLAEAKDFFIFCFGILSTVFFASKQEFTGNIIYKYFVYIIIPFSILNAFSYNNVYYLPFTTGNVNIFGNDVTKHSTAIIGNVLFIGAGYNILKTKERVLKKDILFLILSFYFIAFSGSRSCLLALIATILLYIINRNNYKRVITSIYFSVLLFLVFLMEHLQKYVHLINNKIILDLIKADNFKNYGVTTGREWLWNFHWKAFINSKYLLGGGRAVTDFNVNDYLPLLRIKAPAGGESPYTSLIACNGIIGFLQLGILFYLSYYAIKRKNLLATCIIFFGIYNSTMGVNMTSIIHASGILLFLLYFSSFKRIKSQ